MIRFSLLVVLLLLAMFDPTPARAQSDVWVKDGFITRLTFFQSTVSEQNNYVLGVVDGVLLSPLFSGNSAKERALGECLLEKQVTSTQVRLTTLKLIEDEPEYLNESAHVAVYNAIKAICPTVFEEQNDRQ